MRFVASMLVFALWSSFGWAGDEGRVLDNFDELAGWTVSSSPGVDARLSRDAGVSGSALRLDFDFHGAIGSVILRKDFPVALPENYAFSFQVRGEAPTNNLDFKVFDQSGESVWWRRSYDVPLVADWRPFRISKSRLEFAWGTSGGAPLRQLSALELAFTASSGGKGMIWLDDLLLENREPVVEYTSTPVVTASAAAAGHGPGVVLDELGKVGWHSGASVGAEWLQLDFLRRRGFGAAVIDWDERDYATAYEIKVSDDGRTWRSVYAVDAGNGGRDYAYLPETASRYFRLELKKSSRGLGYGIRTVGVKPEDFSGSANRFFENIARDAPIGWYPRYFLGEQSYFTVVGADGGETKEGLLNTDGTLEVDKGAFTIEPFVYLENGLVTWNDVSRTAALEQGYLPIPSVTWRRGELSMSVTAFAGSDASSPVLYGRYRLENRGSVPLPVSLFLALRPFQVNPPWQSLNTEGGVSPIHALRGEEGGVWVNGDRWVRPLTPPSRFGAVAFEQGEVMDFLLKGQVPAAPRVEDKTGFASGVFAYDVRLGPGAVQEFYVAIPQRDRRQFQEAVERAGQDASALGRDELLGAVEHWEKRLAVPRINGPVPVNELVARLRSNLAYIFIHRDGASLQPGSRTYARTWIRDGAIMSSALLGMGYGEEVRQFIRWYAGFQSAEGKIPCCVDQRGADSVIENDSHGEFIYAIAEYYRYTRDIGLVRELWPHVVKAVGYIEQLRAKSMTDAYLRGDKSAFYGLVPESISHEGYAARPVHAFWDGFWTLRGLKDAAYLAEQIADKVRTSAYARLRDDYSRDLHAALLRTMKDHEIRYLPASVELADFDPNALATAVSVIGEQYRLPRGALNKTFDDWFDYFVKRRDGEIPWDAYTPYEVRSVEALVRLGRREQANEVLGYLLRDQRPAAWNGWAEVVWRDASVPKFIGDMPHAWIGAEFIRAIRSFFVYEREKDSALVLAAGLSPSWIESDGGISIEHMPTWYGSLSYQLVREGGETWRMRLSGNILMPSGGIAITLPSGKSLRSVTINSRPSLCHGSEVVVKEFPADVVFHFSRGKAGGHKGC